MLIGDRYVIGDVLGVGGMGIVYAGRVCDRDIAVKVPRPELVDNAYVMTRFRGEALAGSRIVHRNVVRVLDSGEWDGTPYIVMERVPGTLLGVLLADHGPMAIATAAPIVFQLLAAIEAIHDAGIIHGDIKCDNVLVDVRDGSVMPKLIDFGLARFVARGQNRDTIVSGTVEYLAPELIAGLTPSTASDQYAAAVLVYELLVGRAPFQGETIADVNEQRDAGPIEPLSRVRRDLACCDELDGVLARALDADPDARFPDIAELANALANALGAVRIAAGSKPMAAMSAAASEAPTRTWRVGSDAVATRRRALARALSTGTIEQGIVAYLDLATAFVDEHRLAAAALELEHGVAWLGGGAGAWRLQTSLAGIYELLGERTRARRTAREACEAARRDGSTIGVQRAQRLVGRLVRR